MLKKNIQVFLLVIATLFFGQVTVLAQSADTIEEDIQSQTNLSAESSAAKRSVCDGLKSISPDSNTDCDDKTEVNNLVSTIISILSWVMGVVAVIMIIIGSFKYITSGGDSGKVASAKNTIIYALVGLAIAALSQVLVRFVLSNAK